MTTRNYVHVDPVTGVADPDDLGTGADGSGDHALLDDGTWGTVTGGSGAPTTADYLVGTTQAGLSAEIVVGTSPGGELGGTWASPTVDATHSGSSHAGVVATHEGLADPHTGYRLESADHSHESTGLQGGQIDEDALALTDVTTMNASTTRHGFLKKLDNSATSFMNGQGNWASPTGTGSVASDTIWDAKGDLAAGTGADTAGKLTVGANDTILMADSAQSTGLKWVAAATPSTQAYGDAAAEGTADTFTRGDHKHAMPAAILLAETHYAPGTDTTVLNAGTATSATDVDATNDAITFTAPASGNVMIDLSAMTQTSNGSNPMYWGVRESTTLKAEAWAVRDSAINRITVSLYVSGLTPGNSYTYKWSYRIGAAGTSGTIYGGPAYGRNIMRVWAAP